MQSGRNIKGRGRDARRMAQQTGESFPGGTCRSSRLKGATASSKGGRGTSGSAPVAAGSRGQPAKQTPGLPTGSAMRDPGFSVSELTAAQKLSRWEKFH